MSPFYSGTKYEGKKWDKVAQCVTVMSLNNRMFSLSVTLYTVVYMLISCDVEYKKIVMSMLSIICVLYKYIKFSVNCAVKPQSCSKDGCKFGCGRTLK